MKCSVAVCGREASVMVHFRPAGAYPFCRFHAYDRRGDPRWSYKHLRHVERLR